MAKGNPNGNPQKMKRGPGRPKGSKDRVPSELKAKVLHIVQDLEDKGIGLPQQAEADPKWFFEHFVKALLPKAVTGDFNVQVTAVHQDIEKMTDEEIENELGEFDHR